MRFLFTKYKIGTMVTEIEAESIEEAQEKLNEDSDEIAWMVIPPAEFGFFSTPAEDDS
jgi:hypothetical protein